MISSLEGVFLDAGSSAARNRQQTVQVAPNVHIYPAFPFVPASLRIDNNTSSYIYFPQIKVWVDPFRIGRVIPWPVSLQEQIEIQSGITPDSTIPAIITSTTQNAVVTAYADPQPLSDGQVQRLGQQLSQQVLNPNGDVILSGTNKTYVLPPGTHAIAVYAEANNGSNNSILVSSNDVIGYPYILGNIAIGAWSLFWAPIAAIGPSGIRVTANGGDMTVYIIVIFDVEAPVITQAPNTSFVVKQDPLTSNVKSKPFNTGAIAPNASATIVAGVGSKVIRLWSLFVTNQAVDTLVVSFQDTAVTPVLVFNMLDIVAGANFPVPLFGLPLTGGQSLVAKNTSGAATVTGLVGGVIYDLQ